ncbi:hypothetical protein NTJ20_001359 [Flavobacterium psychrophilum]|nr:hypothetical protein [Flavobacterium psychrophilum]EKT4508366.1 hypothetical protein [Flavobacterium psychrophilum]
MKLISMTDFVLDQYEKLKSPTLFEETVFNYAIFLKQPLKLEMFIPCDEKGNILKGKPLSPNTDAEWIRWEKEEFEFYKARDKVLFNNFKFVESHKEGIDNNLEYFIFPYGENRFGLTKKQKGFRTWFQLFTVEDLVQCDLSLAVPFEAIT